MPSTLKEIQDHLERSAPSDAAIGVSLWQLRRLLVRRIRKMQSGKIAEDLPIRTTRLSLTAKIQNALPKLEIDTSAAGSHVRLDGAEIRFDVHEQGHFSHVLSSFSLEFHKIWAKATYENDTLRLLHTKQSDGIFRRIGTLDLTLIEKHFPDTGDKTPEEQYQLFEYMVQVNAAIEAPAVLIESIEFPQLPRALKSFHALPPYQITELGSYLVVQPSRVIEEAEPSKPCDGTVIRPSPGPATPHPDPDPAKSYLELKPTYSVQNTALRPIPHSPDERPQVFFFTPSSLEETHVFDPVMPAVAANDNGGAWGIYWEYFAHAGLKNFSFDRSGQSIAVDTSWDIRGHAGAGIKIGCIKWEVLGANIEGVIRSIKVTLHLEVDPHGRVVTRSESDVDGVEIRIHSSDIFPLSKVAELILDSYARKAIPVLIKEAVRNLERVLIDPSDVYSIPIDNPWFFKNITAKSTIIGMTHDDRSGTNEQPDGKWFVGTTV